MRVRSNCQAAGAQAAVRIALDAQSTLEVAADDFLGEVSEKVTGRAIKIDKARLRAVLDALKTLRLVGSAGGANPKFTARQVVQNKKDIEILDNWLEAKENELNESTNRLRDEVRSYLKREVRS